VPDLACDCAQAELVAQQARLIEHKVKLGAMDPQGSPCTTIYERPPCMATQPRRASSDLLKEQGADDWAPEDVYRSVPSCQSDTYPRLGRPLVTFKGEGCSAGTAATLQRIPDHPGLCPGNPPPHEDSPTRHAHGYYNHSNS
jgi:hypothetical protein